MEEKFGAPAIPAHNSTILLSGFWAKIGGVLRDAASTTTGGELTVASNENAVYGAVQKEVVMDESKHGGHGLAKK